MEQNWPNQKIISVNQSINYTEQQIFKLLLITGRCAAHVAVLKENEEILDYIASKYKQSLRVGDNVCFNCACVAS